MPGKHDVFSYGMDGDVRLDTVVMGRLDSLSIDSRYHYIDPVYLIVYIQANTMT